MDDTVFLSTTKAAQFLGLSPRTLQKWRSNPPARYATPRYHQTVGGKGGAPVYYTLDDLRAWREQTAKQPTPRPSKRQNQAANA